MILPPLIIDVTFREEGSRGFRLWLPLFLLWPLLLPLVVLVILGTMLVDLLLLMAGASYHYYTAFVIGALHLVSELRGTHVHVTSSDTLVHVVII